MMNCCPSGETSYPGPAKTDLKPAAFKDQITVCRHIIFPDDYECSVGRTVFVEHRPDNYLDFANPALRKEEN